MAQLTDNDVLHIAKLARLTLKDGEASKFAKELSSIFTYVDMLQEVDTTGVKVTANATGISNSFRDDVLRSPEHEIPRDALLSTSPLPIVDYQIQTPSAHG